MSFASLVNKSVSNYRVLLQWDISTYNWQWMNIGAGIWYVNFSGTYSEVGPSGDDLLSGFTSQTFGDIGSILVDSIPYVLVNTLLDVTNNEISFFYDRNLGNVYVHFVNNDEPFLHQTFLGVIYGYSYDSFKPLGSNTFYDGRLLGDLSIGESRDPLYFGKLNYTIASFSLVNNDGNFDTFSDNYKTFGNEVRLYIGYLELDISEYVKIQSSTVEKITINEDTINVILADKRKALTKSISFKTTNQNALEAIRDILYLNYNATYNNFYYDTTAWAIAEALVGTITIDIESGKGIEENPIIDIIEMICSSVFGLFKITPDNKYSFLIVDTTATASTIIYDYDILNKNEIEYDLSEVISSAKVGYSKNWESTYTSPYTFYINTAYESTVFQKYGIFNQKTFFTVSNISSDAVVLSNTIMNYVKDVHGIGSITVPIKYYSIEVGNIINIEINRETTTMLGTKKCEIVSRRFNVKNGLIDFKYRII